MAQVPPAVGLRVLFVEDSPDDVELIRLELQRHGFNIQERVVETRSDFLKAVRGEAWDVVLSDHSMKGFSSTDALHLLRDYDSPIPARFYRNRLRLSLYCRKFVSVSRVRNR